jgi:hypothetical protein
MIVCYRKDREYTDRGVFYCINQMISGNVRKNYKTYLGSCRILGSQSDVYEEMCLLEYNAM